jgi:inorganic triphosphatase YgiF
MPLERELKFSVLEAYVPSLSEVRAALAETPFDAEAAPVQELHDRYFDDEGGSLKRAGLALRRRRLGAKAWAGLKASGTSDAGLFERDELEVPLADADGAPWPDVIVQRLAGLVDVEALEPRVELDTTRVPFRVLRDGTAIAELGFDAVAARAPGAERSAFFDEVEIEAREATARADLEQIAEAVDGLVKLTPNPVNKLERAAALLLLATW